MAFPLKKKPDFSVILGMGPKRPAESAPPDFASGASDSEPDPADPNEAAENENESGAGIKPEAVSYRTSAETCGSCEYMQDDGNCSQLKMLVDEADGCNLHTEKQGGEMAGGEGAPMEGEMADEGQPV